MDDRRPELFKLSNQLIEVYVQDIFARNEVDLNKLKDRITDEQRENIKSTVNMLKEQVDDFLHKQNTRKQVTEDSEEAKPSESPLRAKIIGKDKEEN